MRFVYIVDDDPIVRKAIGRALRGGPGQLVRSFENGAGFLREADELDPGAVLLDLHMPRIDGNAVLEALQARGDDKFLAIVVTGSDSIAGAVRAMQLGAVDVIEKPFAPEPLHEALNEAFAMLEANCAAAAASAEASERIAGLSQREREVLECLFEGHPNKVAAEQLGISPRTVEIYRAGAMRKLGVRGLAEAVRLAIDAGWPPLRGMPHIDPAQGAPCIF